MKTKKRMLWLAAVSVALLTVMTAAGTFAYLQDGSEDVVNNFETGKVEVTLIETGTDTEGNKQYHIIPGTEETKDPTVTVDNTVDSYVFVTVKDTTGGKVNYAVADGWTLWKKSGTSTVTSIYYREVGKDDAEKTFAVLKDNKVSYDASLTNEEMPDGDTALTFTARAIQKDGFADITDAFNGLDAVTVADLASLRSVSRKNSIIIGGDIQSSNSAKMIQLQGNPAYINLSGYTVSNVTDGKGQNFMVFYVKPSIGGKVRIENGTIAGTEEAAGEIYGIDVANNSSVYVNNVTFENCLTAVQVEKGTAYIEGGFYHCTPVPGYTLNCIDNAYKSGTANIIVTGGTFVNFDPSNNAAEGEGTNFVAEGYIVVSEEHGDDIWYTVVRDADAENP